MKKRPIPASAWAKIRLFAMDVDGILTDGGVFIASDKTETKRFCIIDGLGLVLVRASGVDLAWVSGRPRWRRPCGQRSSRSASDPGQEGQA